MSDRFTFPSPLAPLDTGGAASSVTDAFALEVDRRIISMLAGDAADGDADLDGVAIVAWATLAGSTYTMTRQAFCGNVTVRNGITLICRGFEAPFCTGTFTVDTGGVVHADGAAASGATAGAAFTAGSLPANIAGGAGGNGGNGAAGGSSAGSPVSITNRFIGGDGGGGTGTNGGTGGSVTGSAATRGAIRAGAPFLAGFNISQLGIANWTGPGAGGAGGGQAAAAGPVGGGGGAGGGFLKIIARDVVNNGTIRAHGGAGAAGAGAGAGGGGGGGGGIVQALCGSWTGNQPTVYGGVGGNTGGGGTAPPGGPGTEGWVEIATPSGRYVGNYIVSLSASEMAAAITSGILDVSGTCTIGLVPDTNDIYFFKGTTADGEISLKYDTTNRRLDLKVRGTVVLSTTGLGANPAAPTCQNYKPGDMVDWRIWYDPAGGAKSIGIRFGVNGCFGNDTTGTGSGSALAAFSSAYALGRSATAWSASTSIFAGSKSASPSATVVILGDSTHAPRVALPAVGSCLRTDNATAIASIAQGGATLANQLATWQGCVWRGAASVTKVIIGLGVNDAAAARTAAQMTTDLQAIVNDVHAQNPNATIYVCPGDPARTYLTETQYTAYDTYRQNVLGTGGTPITGATPIDTFTTMEDGHGCLLYHIGEKLHPTLNGRKKKAAALQATVAA